MLEQLQIIESGLDIANKQLKMKESNILYTAFANVQKFVKEKLEEEHAVKQDEKKPEKKTTTRRNGNKE